MAVLFWKLDIVFKNERIDEAYNAYSKFIAFEKKAEMSVVDYLA